LLTIAVFGVISLAASLFLIRYNFNLVLNSYLILFTLAMFFNEMLYLYLHPHPLDEDVVFLVCVIFTIYVVVMRFGTDLIASVTHDTVDPTIAFCERVPDRVLFGACCLYLITRLYLVHRVGAFLAFNAGRAASSDAMARLAGGMGMFDQAVGMLTDPPALGAMVIATVKAGIRPSRVFKMMLIIGPIVPLYLISDVSGGARRVMLALVLLGVLSYYYARDFRLSMKHIFPLLMIAWLLYLAGGYYQLIRGNFADLYVEQHGHLSALSISQLIKTALEPQPTRWSPSTISGALEKNASERSQYFDLVADIATHELRHPSGALGGKIFLGEIEEAIPRAFFPSKKEMNLKQPISIAFNEPNTDLAVSPFADAIADFGIFGVCLVPLVFLGTYFIYRWLLVRVRPATYLLGPTVIAVLFNLILSFEAGLAVFVNLRSVILVWLVTLPAWVIKELLYPPWGAKVPRPSLAYESRPNGPPRLGETTEA